MASRPKTVEVAYQTPHIRALSAAQRTALAGLASTVLLAVIPLILTFIRSNDFSVAALKTLGVGVSFTALTTIYVYLQKHSEATADDAHNPPVPPSP